MREDAKQLVIDVFNIDIKGEIGRMARQAVPKEDKADITNRVHRHLNAAYHQGFMDAQETSHAERQAGWFWGGIIRYFGCAGIALPWRVIYILPESWDDAALRAHERQHIKQIDRDGPVKWTIKYYYYLARYGYHMSPYEIDARHAEDDAR